MSSMFCTDLIDETFFVRRGVKLGVSTTFLTKEEDNDEPEVSCVPFGGHGRLLSPVKGNSGSTKKRSRRRSLPEHPPHQSDFDWDCGICLETASDPCVSTCGHLFCYVDLHRWLEKNLLDPRCPVCKAPCHPDVDVVPIFGRGRGFALPQNPDSIPYRPLTLRSLKMSRSVSVDSSTSTETVTPHASYRLRRHPPPRHHAGVEFSPQPSPNSTSIDEKPPTPSISPSNGLLFLFSTSSPFSALLDHVTLAHLLGHAFSIAALAIFLTVLLS